MGAEIVAIAIRNDQDTISQIEHKIKLLADDTTSILANINSLIKSISIFNNFTKLSGLKLNMQKTEVIPLLEKSNSAYLHLYRTTK